jgi:hypothetical protein
MLHTRELQLGLVPGREVGRRLIQLLEMGYPILPRGLSRRYNIADHSGRELHVSEHAAIDLDRGALAVQDLGCDQSTN